MRVKRGAGVYTTDGIQRGGIRMRRFGWFVLDMVLAAALLISCSAPEAAQKLAEPGQPTQEATPIASGQPQVRAKSGAIELAFSVNKETYLAGDPIEITGKITCDQPTTGETVHQFIWDQGEPVVNFLLRDETGQLITRVRAELPEKRLMHPGESNDFAVQIPRDKLAHLQSGRYPLEGQLIGTYQQNGDTLSPIDQIIRVETTINIL